MDTKDSSFIPSMEDVDAIRAEALAESRIVQPIVPGIEDGRRRVEISYVSRRSRAALFVAKTVRAAGAVAFLAGAYQGVASGLELHDKKEAVIEQVDDAELQRVDESLSRLLVGGPVTAEETEAIADAFNSLSNDLQTASSQVDDLGQDVQGAAQDIFFGTGLMLAGQAGVAGMRRRQDRNKAYLDTGFGILQPLFTPPLKPHVSRVDGNDDSPVLKLKQMTSSESGFDHRMNRAMYGYEKIFVIGMTALALSSIPSSGEVAEQADRLVPAVMYVEPLQDKAQGIAETLSTDFSENAVDEVVAAVESQLPQTMAIVDSNEAASELYADTIDEMTEVVPAQSAIDSAPNPQLFSRTNDFLRVHADNLTASPNGHAFAILTFMVALGSVLVAKMFPDNFKTGRARVSLDFLQKHLDSKLPKN